MDWSAHRLPRVVTAFCGLAVALNAGTSGASTTTVLHLDRVIEIEHTLADPNDLWVLPEDLTRINDFVLKPQGACLDELCIPVRQDEDSEMFVRRQNQGWFNVTALARKLDQAYAHDADAAVWSFAEMPIVRRGALEAGLAPDFELLDKDGQLRRLSDYRGKKVAIVTWASW